ncbi:hypothetical protein H257_14742 [Aphanomyces astaci]|uniref:Thioredoxin-like fold domain-containing protein n=1 Tax=Aphanomyces astaci TaxID=112090 RepID=W4FSL2_APHAT|nr:hypothetical protein H257_14742 [Aphanomyces astaci]ETV69603.1 hypothetical protein H257_14742 [Aphanomyces astaci]|eukprot:XP_009840930.1 hypothetical protein H257_14742 [Aphanomyces astaci]
MMGLFRAAIFVVLAMLPSCSVGDIPTTTPGFTYKDGLPQAPVHLQVFIDLLCPYSKAAYPALKQLRDTFEGKDFRLTFQMLPLPFHRDAFLAAQSTLSVSFVPWLETIYANQDKLSNTNTLNTTSNQSANTPEYLNYDAAAPISEQNLFMPLFSRRVRNVYGWLTWITSSLLLFNFCENDMARRYSNLGPISNKTLMKRMHQIGSTYYVAVFASFPSDSLRGYEKVLLALSPMNDEESLSATAFLEFFDFVLDVYGERRRNVVVLIGDNCATNRAFTRLAGIPMVGCASHRFNLFVSDPNDTIVSQAAQQDTMKLIGRHIDDIDMLLLNGRQDRDVEPLIAQITDLNSVTLALRDE